MTRFRPYIALFLNGARQSLNDKVSIFGCFLMYVTLLAIWVQIFRMIPLPDLDKMGITYHHLTWYFAVTEGIIISAPGLARFGMLIEEGRITEMMQRPVSMMGMVITRLLGQQAAMAAVTMAPVFIVLGIIAPIDFNFLLSPYLLLSFILGAILYQFLCYLTGMVEIFGPYSRPLSWIVGKFVFSFGGLFFPVMFFPDWLQRIVWMTPFPAVIYVPGSVVLQQDAGSILNGIGIQCLWVLILAGAALFAEQRMLRRVMRVGD